MLDLDKDTRFLDFAEDVRQVLRSPVSVLDGALLIGSDSNCLRVFSSGNHTVNIAWHRYCHPLYIVSTFALFRRFFPFGSFVVAPCFLLDVNSAPFFEGEEGFDSVKQQWLRAAVSIEIPIVEG